MNNKERGITLTTLVVTIIVLLILTGVTVTQLTSDNGLIEQTQNETDYHQEAIENEQRKMNSVTESQLQDWGF